MAVGFACKDHPRSRGEYARSGAPAVDPDGSSPLSRGIPHDPAPDTRSGRIIPALAGNTDRTLGHLGYCPDHPRSRGEYLEEGQEDCVLTGSSPLSRGIPGVAWQWALRVRIIPALAGNTVS